MIPSSAMRSVLSEKRANQNSSHWESRLAVPKCSIAPPKPWHFSMAGAFCTPEDIKPLVVPVFAHRVVVNGLYSSTLKKSEQAEQVIREIVESTPVPV